MTDPPLVGNVAYLVARRFRRPLVLVVQDVFPETAVKLGRLEQPLVISVLRRLIAHVLRRADRVVAIGPVMRDRLIAKGARAERTVVIPNWVDTSAITPLPKNNGWSHAQELDDRFVVMHSGNIGHAQNLETLIRAVPLLEDLDRLTVVLIGFGARHAAMVDLARRVAGDRVRFLPYQPRERLSESLSAADVHYVGLAHGLAGYVVPSRVYGIMAAGRPIIAAVDPGSETAAAVRAADSGLITDPDAAEQVADAIRTMASGAVDLAAMGARARAYVEHEGSRAAALARYRELLADVRS
jgi:glycosyltransferase involved in cell wall biosynthesis